MSQGGRIITRPLIYDGTIDPFFLEKISIPRGELINALEKYGRLCFEQARKQMQAINRTPWSGYDHFVNSELSHNCINEIVGKK